MLMRQYLPPVHRPSSSIVEHPSHRGTAGVGAGPTMGRAEHRSTLTSSSEHVPEVPPAPRARLCKSRILAAVQRMMTTHPFPRSDGRIRRVRDYCIFAGGGHRLVPIADDRRIHWRFPVRAKAVTAAAVALPSVPTMHRVWMPPLVSSPAYRRWPLAAVEAAPVPVPEGGA